MAEVPDPPSGSRSYWTEAYDKMRALPDGKAMKLQFGSESHASYARTRLKKLAEADKSHGKVFSSSRSVDGLTRYFWLEKA